MIQVRGIPTSRAYWELKAEQVMHRVFAPEPSIDLEIIEPQVRTPAPKPESAERQTTASPAPIHRSRRQRSSGGPNHQDERLLLVGGLALMTLMLAGGTLAGLGLWSQLQRAQQQERNLLLIQRLRNLSPAAAGPTANTTSPAPGAVASGAGPELPPPPPEEPWMQELATLPSSAAPPARVLQVPMSNQVGAPAPPARAIAATSRGTPASPASASGGLPQMVGVIQIPGRGSSAIFQVDGNSTSAGIGESIGSSGWRLRSASGDTALIERGGEQRRVSISSGL